VPAEIGQSLDEFFAMVMAILYDPAAFFHYQSHSA
jgi:hypothetical protein